MKKQILVGLVVLFNTLPAHALRYNTGDFSFGLTGYGTAGFINPDFKDGDFLGDWRVRGQMGYRIDNTYSFGAVYAIDAITLEEDKYMREGYVFLDGRSLGRIEVGFTDSIARKLGVGLPDVGGLRINDKSLIYKKIHPKNTIIADTNISTGRNALRVNMTSAPQRMVQYGVSVAGLTDDYDYAIDAGIKVRNPAGKIKTAYSAGVSFMDSPDKYTSETYTAAVTADWRAQAYMGMNLQYNSWIWGINARAIYDENPIGAVSDGLALGTGISYDILNYTLSANYILSDTGIWDSDIKNEMTHTALASFRYKYSENVDGWTSVGISSDKPFLSCGLRLTF